MSLFSLVVERAYAPSRMAVNEIPSSYVAVAANRIEDAEWTALTTGPHQKPNFHLQRASMKGTIGTPQPTSEGAVVSNSGIRRPTYPILRRQPYPIRPTRPMPRSASVEGALLPPVADCTGVPDSCFSERLALRGTLY